MPVRIGFSNHRRRLLESELHRIASELPPLGVASVHLTGGFAVGRVDSDTGLEFVVVHDTDAPFIARPDFFLSHLLPRVEARFIVYTPAEFEEMKDTDPFLIRALKTGERIHAG